MKLPSEAAVIFLLILCGAVALTGCSPQSPVISTPTSSSGGSGGGSSGRSGSAGTSVLSGVLSVDNTATPTTITSQSLAPHAASPAKGYVIMATDVESGQGTRETTGTDGAYSLSLSTTKGYVFVVFDDSSRLAAIVTGTQKRDSSGNKLTGLVSHAGDVFVVSAFQSTAQEAKGANVVLNSKKGAAWWKGKDEDLKAVLGLQPMTKYLARADASGIAVGTGGANVNFGKGSAADKPGGFTSTIPIDTDGDGIPDNVDADADGNGKADSTENSTTLSSKKLFNHEIIRAIFVRAMTDTNDTGDGSLALSSLQFNLGAPTDAKAALIDTVKISAGPSYIQTSELGMDNPAQFEPVSGLPQKDGPWKDADFKLFRVRGERNWFAEVNPGSQKSTAKVGDAFTLLVTYKDGRNPELFTFILDSIMTTSPTVTKINSDTVKNFKALVAAGADNPYETSESQMTLTWQRPKDQSGADMFGLGYRITLWYYKITDTKNPGGIELSKSLTTEDYPTGEDERVDNGLGDTLSMPDLIPIKKTVTVQGTTHTVDMIRVELLTRIPGSGATSRAGFFLRPK